MTLKSMLNSIKKFTKNAATYLMQLTEQDQRNNQTLKKSNLMNIYIKSRQDNVQIF